MNEVGNGEVKNAGDVGLQEVDSENKERKMEENLSADLDRSYQILASEQSISSFGRERNSEFSSISKDSSEKFEDAVERQNGSAIDRAKDYVFGKESAYDAKRFEDAGIKGSFDELPRNRRESVYERFENAPSEIKTIVNDLSGELRVEDTVGKDGCHYDLVEKVIRMEKDMDNSEYSEVFSHEFGHFADDKKGNVSFSNEFRESVFKDLEKYDRNTEEGRKNFNDMMDDLMNSDAAYDRAVSDNMSAYFKNDPAIIERYYNEGIPYYQHDNVYWSTKGNCEAEIYANSFSMDAQDNKASCVFMEKYFPNTWEQFKKTL